MASGTVAAPAAVSPSTYLSGVSCWAATGCMAVGSSTDSQAGGRALAERWNRQLVGRCSHLEHRRRTLGRHPLVGLVRLVRPLQRGRERRRYIHGRAVERCRVVGGPGTSAGR
jgi:hypothetical protein